MVSTLTRNSIFRVPPFTQPLFLFGITHRAVSLSTVKPVKLMPVFTVCFSCIYSTYTTAIKSIGFSCENSKVVWLNTVSFPTNMINNHVFWYVAYGKIVGDSVSTPIFTTKIKRAISVFIKWRLPQMTRTNFFPLTIKPFFFIFCKSLHKLPFTPVMPFSIHYA